MTGGRVDQTSVAGVLRDHRARIRALEATPPPTFTGLQYDFDNEGDWFFARANVGEVNRDGDGTTVVSWEFSTGASGAPILFDGDGGFVVDTAGNVVIDAVSGAIIGAASSYTGPALPGSLEVNGGDITAWLATGKTLTVKDNVGNPIFEVREDGSLHGLTGQNLTFDL